MPNTRDSLLNQLRVLLDTDETDEIRLLELTIEKLQPKSKSATKRRKGNLLSAIQIKTLKYLAAGYPMQIERRSYIIITPDGQWKITRGTVQKLQALGLIDGLYITQRGKDRAAKLH